jgi:hypothetical protein
MSGRPWCAALAFCLAAGAVSAQRGEDRQDWIALFNGRDLDGWTPKITGYPLGVNHLDTFRVEDGVLKVSYDRYEQFEDTFGHLFYGREAFSYYRLVAEYRFVGEQAPGSPGWAVRNNGLMLHSQGPETMGLRQDFPISIEVQLLGGAPAPDRTTANVCTPGTEIFMQGAMVRNHCTNSTSRIYRGDEWVRVEVDVRGGERVRHFVDGQTVLEYENLQIGGGTVSNFNPAVKKDGAPLTAGYIAIQGESHPTEFRRIELLKLSGCMKIGSPAYRSYFVHRDDSKCDEPGSDP